MIWWKGLCAVQAILSPLTFTISQLSESYCQDKPTSQQSPYWSNSAILAMPSGSWHFPQMGYKLVTHKNSNNKYHALCFESYYICYFFLNK